MDLRHAASLSTTPAARDALAPEPATLAHWSARCSVPMRRCTWTSP